MLPEAEGPAFKMSDFAMNERQKMEDKVVSRGERTSGWRGGHQCFPLFRGTRQEKPVQSTCANLQLYSKPFQQTRARYLQSSFRFGRCGELAFPSAWMLLHAPICHANFVQSKSVPIEGSEKDGDPCYVDHGCPLRSACSYSVVPLALRQVLDEQGGRPNHWSLSRKKNACTRT